MKTWLKTNPQVSSTSTKSIKQSSSQSLVFSATKRAISTASFESSIDVVDCPKNGVETSSQWSIQSATKDSSVNVGSQSTNSQLLVKFSTKSLSSPALINQVDCLTSERSSGSVQSTTSFGIPARSWGRSLAPETQSLPLSQIGVDNGVGGLTNIINDNQILRLSQTNAGKEIDELDQLWPSLPLRKQSLGLLGIDDVDCLTSERSSALVQSTTSFGTSATPLGQPLVPETQSLNPTFELSAIDFDSDNDGLTNIITGNQTLQLSQINIDNEIIELPLLPLGAHPSSGLSGIDLVDDPTFTIRAARTTERVNINSQRHRSRKRAADPEAYRLKVRADKSAWAEKNQDKVNKIAAKSQNKSRELRRFYCGVCEIAFQSDSALKKHTLTNNHVDRLAGVTKSAPSDHVIATAAARDAAKANKTHYCSTCDKAFGDDCNLRRHNATPSHAKRVERLKS